MYHHQEKENVELNLTSALKLDSRYGSSPIVKKGVVNKTMPISSPATDASLARQQKLAQRSPSLARVSTPNRQPLYAESKRKAISINNTPKAQPTPYDDISVHSSGFNENELEPISDTPVSQPEEETDERKAFQERYNKLNAGASLLSQSCNFCPSCKPRWEQLAVEHDKKVKDFSNALINSQADVEEYQERYNKIQEEGKSLYATYLSRCARLKDVSTRFEQTKDDMMRIERENAELREKLAESMKYSGQDVSIEMERLEKENQELKERLAEEANKTEEWKVKCNSQAARFKENFASYRALREEYEQRTLELDLARKEISDLKSMAGSLPEASAPASVDVTQTPEYLELSEVVESQKAAIADYERQIEELQTQVDRIISPMPSPKPSPSRHPIPQSPSAHSGLNSAVLEKLESIGISNELLREENSNLQRELGNKETNYRNLQASYNAQSAEMKSLKSELEKKEREIEEECRGYQDQLRLMQENFEAETKELKDTIEDLEARLRHFDKEGAGIREQMIQYKEETERALVEKEEALNKLKEQTTIARNLENDLRLVYKKHQKDLQQLRDQFHYDQYREKYHDAISRLEIAEKRLADTKGVVDQARSVVKMHEAAQELIIQTKLAAKQKQEELLKLIEELGRSAALKKQLDASCDEVKSLQSQIAKYKYNIKQLELVIKEHIDISTFQEHERLTLLQTIADLESEKDVLAKELKAAKENTEALNERILKLEETCAEKENAIIVGTEESNKLGEELQLTKSELEAAKTRVSELEEAIRTKDEAIAQTTEQKAALDSKVEEQSTKIQSLETTVAEQLERLAKEEEALKEKSDQIAVQEEKLTEQSTSIAELKETVEKHEATIEQQTSELSQRDVKIQEQSADIQTLEEKLKEHQQTISTLEESVKQNAETISTLETTLSEKNESISQLEAQLSEKNATIESLEESIKEKSELIAKNEEKIAENESRITQQEEELKSDKATISNLEDTIAKQAEDLLEKTTIIADKETAFEQLSQELQQLTEAKQANEKLIEELQGAKSELEQKIADATAELSALEQKLEETIKERDEISEKLSSTEKEKTETEKSLSEIQDALNERITELCNSKQQLVELEEKLMKLQAQYEQQVAATEENRKAYEKSFEQATIYESNLKKAVVTMRLLENEKNQMALQKEILLLSADIRAGESLPRLLAEKLNLEQKVSSLSVKLEAQTHDIQRLTLENDALKKLTKRF